MCDTFIWYLVEKASFTLFWKSLLSGVVAFKSLLANTKIYSKYKKVGVLPIRIVKSNVSSVGPSSEKNSN